MKSLKDISDNITEDDYRNDGKMHYSTLATFARGGFNSIESLNEKKESPSLLFGQCVDALITGGQKEFDDRFIVAEFPEIPDTVEKIVNDLFAVYSNEYHNLSDIPDNDIIRSAANWNYQNNWKPETRAKVIKEKGSDYYRLMFLAGTKTIISNTLYNEVLATVSALKESEATKWYFTEDNPFDNSIERLYQLKWHSTFNGIEYSCMMDLAIVLHDKKLIIPIDLKTSSHKEYDFFKSFIDWFYMIQSRLYWRILRDNLDRDEYFKDFTLANYRFIVANKQSLTPLVWVYEDTQKYGTLFYGKNKQIECRDPYAIAEELKRYLDMNPKVPFGINEKADNNLIEWLDTL